MSSAFVAFDEVRDHLQDALHAAGRPEGAPSIYVVRDRIGKVGISVSEEFGGDDRLRAALDLSLIHI